VVGRQRPASLDANLTWVILLAMMAAMAIIRKINLVGYPNRLLVVLYCAWAMTVAWQAMERRPS